MKLSDLKTKFTDKIIDTIISNSTKMIKTQDEINIIKF